MRIRGRAAAAAPLISLLALTACSGSSHDTGGASSSGASSKAGASSSSGGSASPSASSSVAPPEPVKNKPGSITIGASGDLIVHPSVTQMARRAAGGTGYRFDQFFGQISPVTKAGDLRICQMENPLSRDDTNLARELSFNAPHEFATTVKSIGFDGCSTANNHAYDRGLSGLASTRSVMAANGLQAAGPAASACEKGQPVFYEAKGFKVAQLSYSYTLDNRINGDQTGTPKDAPWVADNLYAVRTPEGIEADAAEARKQGADIVVVSMHWGREYKPVSAEQKKYADALLRSGQVDWIIGNHPHIVQPCQKIDGRYVSYALGNLFSGQQAAYLPGTADGAYASVTFTRDAGGKISQSMTYQPTYQDQKTRVVELATPSQNPASYAKTTATMGAFGCDAKPAS